MDLFYFDESGLCPCPVVPYAWQPCGQTLEVPAHVRTRLNLIGFFSRDNRSFIQTVEGRVTRQTVIEVMEAFVATPVTPPGPDKPVRLTRVVLDNASIHRSAAVEAHRERWLLKGVILHYLPPYSPELNLIEILWRKLKYEWLPLWAAARFEALKKAVAEVLDNLGEKYQINFG